MDQIADNKKTLLYKRGETDDIVKSVVTVFGESWDQIQDLSQTFQAATVRETCENIANYVVNNFSYKIDPDGEQWIRTPARLLQDRQADCKSFSLFVCAALSNLGINNGFRFVSYTPDKQFTHVYSFAIDENGKKITIDTVAMIQKNVAFDDELKYKHKKDYMNTTRISKLSGVDTEVQEERVLRSTDSVAVVFAKTLYFKAKLLQDDRLSTALQVLISVLQKYTNERDLQLALYKWADLFINVEDTSANTQEEIIKNFVDNVGKENSKYMLDGSVLSDPEYIKLENWLNQYITPFAFDYVAADTETAVNELYENAFNFIYLFVDNKYLTKAQKQKKTNQRILLETIIENTPINTAAAMNLIFCFSLMEFGRTPHNVAAYMFKKIPYRKTELKIGSTEFSGDDITKDLLNEELERTSAKDTSSKNKQETITGWINTGINAFMKVWNTVTGNRTTNNNAVTPTIYDGGSGSSMLTYFIGGVFIVGGFMLLKNKKKKKGGKK